MQTTASSEKKYAPPKRSEKQIGKVLLALSLVRKPILCFYSDVADANFICIREFITASDEFSSKTKNIF